MTFFFIFLYTMDVRDFRFKSKFLSLLLPGIIFMLTNLISGDYTVNNTIAPENYFDYLKRTVPVARFNVVTTGLILLVYALLVLKKYYNDIFSTSRLRRKNFAILFILSGFTIFLVFAYFDYYFGTGIFQTVLKLRFTVMIVFIFLLSYRYPHVLNILKLEGYREYYFTTQTKRLDVEKIVNELNALAEDMAILSDRSLNLKKQRHY